MIISPKDGLKLVGISVVSFCAVYVCTFMLNYYFDVLPLGTTIPEQSYALYEAQLATAIFAASITGGFLGLIAAVMLVFYIKLYVDGHAKQLGIMKALGYSRERIAAEFYVFGLSVFVGCALGFGVGWASMRAIYDGMTIDGIGEIAMTFHVGLLFALVFAPTAVTSVLSVLYAYVSLGRTVGELIRGKSEKIKDRPLKSGKERPFLSEMLLRTLTAKKSLVFFVTFSCFCFSAMVQMGLSMEALAPKTMGYMILAIGILLAVVTMLMSTDSLVRGNSKNISVMKAFGYSLRDCAASVLGGYVPFALIGFGAGSVYQFGLLQLMVNVIFANVGSVPEYTFNVPVFFITLAAFVVGYAAVTAYYILKINRISVKEVMAET